MIEIEESFGSVKQEPESEAEITPPTAKNETPVIKPKSGYRRKRTFECYRCSLACSKLYELRTHIQIFHPFYEPKKEVLNCPHCTKTTTSRILLSRHLRKVSSLAIEYKENKKCIITIFVDRIMPHFNCTNAHAVMRNLRNVANLRSICLSIAIIGRTFVKHVPDHFVQCLSSIHISVGTRAKSKYDVMCAVYYLHHEVH